MFAEKDRIMIGGESVNVVRKEETYTIDDIYALPDGERAELIDGKIYYMAPPSRRHQRILVDLSYQIENYIRNKKGLCEVDIAPFAVFLNEDDINYVEPDISVICDPSKLDEKGCHGAPDWIIEIVSPTNKSMDYYKKLFKYKTAGVREYWVVDPEKKLIMVYRFDKEMLQQYSFGEDVQSGIFEDLSVRVL